jgi:hypothetical protein
MSGHPCLASLARLPDRSTPCRPASAEASSPLLAPRPIPSGIGMTKPTIQQARDRAEVVPGATRPERATSAGSLKRLLTGARNGLANVCSRSGVRIAHSLVEPRERVDFSRSDAMIGWLLLAHLGRSDQARTCPLIAGLCCKSPKMPCAGRSGPLDASHQPILKLGFAFRNPCYRLKFPCFAEYFP